MESVLQLPRENILSGIFLFFLWVSLTSSDDGFLFFSQAGETSPLVGISFHSFTQLSLFRRSFFLPAFYLSLEWISTLVDIFTEFEAPNPWSQPSTIEPHLSHTSSFPLQLPPMILF